MGYFRSQENTRYLHLVHYYCMEDGRPDEAGGWRLQTECVMIAVMSYECAAGI